MTTTECRLCNPQPGDPPDDAWMCERHAEMFVERMVEDTLRIAAALTDGERRGLSLEEIVASLPPDDRTMAQLLRGRFPFDDEAFTALVFDGLPIE